MNFEKELVEGLIHTSHLEKPIPLNIQNYILKVKEKNLIAILKKTDNYNIITGIILSIYFFTRKCTMITPIIRIINILLVIFSLLTFSFPNSFFYSFKNLNLKKNNFNKH